MMEGFIEIQMDGLTGEHLSERIEMHLSNQDPEKTTLIFHVKLLGSQFFPFPKIWIESRPRESKERHDINEFTRMWKGFFRHI